MANGIRYNRAHDEVLRGLAFVGVAASRYGEAMTKTSKQMRVGEVLKAYSTLWRGARPAIVVQAFGPGIANVSILLDQANDLGLGAILPVASVTVFDDVVASETEVLLEQAGYRQASFGRYSVFCTVGQSV